MGSVHFYSFLALFLFCHFDGGNEVLAKKGKCTDACDEIVNINLNLGDTDSYEDDETGKRDLIEEKLHFRIKVLEKEIKTILNNLKKVQKALMECLDRNHLDRKIYDVRELGLCEITPEGCGDDSIDVDANKDPEKWASDEFDNNTLSERILELEKRKNKLQDDTKWVKDSLDECEEKHTKTPETTPSTTPEPTTTTTPKPTTTTTPKPVQKKYIIRTKKVTWNEAVRLCTNEQKQIATITSRSDQDALGQARKDQGVPSGQLWIGGRRTSPSDQFLWRGQIFTAFTYTNWHPTEPSHWSDDDQNCVESSWEASKYMWFVYECDTEFNYACEYY